jgi:hypothetical protein
MQATLLGGSRLNKNPRNVWYNKHRPGDRKPMCLARLYIASGIVEYRQTNGKFGSLTIVPKHVEVNFIWDLLCWNMILFLLWLFLIAFFCAPPTHWLGPRYFQVGVYYNIRNIQKGENREKFKKMKIAKYPKKVWEFLFSSKRRLVFDLKYYCKSFIKKPQ